MKICECAHKVGQTDSRDRKRKQFVKLSTAAETTPRSKTHITQFSTHRLAVSLCVFAHCEHFCVREYRGCEKDKHRLATTSLMVHLRLDLGMRVIKFKQGRVTTCYVMTDWWLSSSVIPQSGLTNRWRSRNAGGCPQTPWKNLWPGSLGVRLIEESSFSTLMSRILSLACFWKNVASSVCSWTFSKATASLSCLDRNIREILLRSQRDKLDYWKVIQSAFCTESIQTRNGLIWCLTHLSWALWCTKRWFSTRKK